MDDELRNDFSRIKQKNRKGEPPPPVYITNYESTIN